MKEPPIPSLLKAFYVMNAYWIHIDLPERYDLSQPLHNTLYNDYNKHNHTATDGIIEDEVLYNLPLIEVYPITIDSEADLAHEVARIANLSLQLGYRLEKEDRMLSRQEAYQQISHSASLLKGVLRWLGK